MQVQIRHQPFSSAIVNDEAAEFLARTDDRPDQFWILNNATGAEFYSVGRYETDNLPADVNGTPVVVQQRGGSWTYHGPGQVSFVIMLNVRRLARITNDTDRSRAVVKFMAPVIEHKFGVPLVYDDVDPGLYNSAGAKVVSFGAITNIAAWIAVKVSVNLNVDVSKFAAIDACGVKNRSMGNLLPGVTITPELTAEVGHDIVHGLIADLYTETAEVETIS